jgi:hypothetical protein
LESIFIIYYFSFIFDLFLIYLPISFFVYLVIFLLSSLPEEVENFQICKAFLEKLEIRVARFFWSTGPGKKSPAPNAKSERSPGLEE